jgi:hypothetical protein
MAGVIVFGSITFGLAFVILWLSRAEVRAWLEAPKHRFQASVRRYDQQAAGERHAPR